MLRVLALLALSGATSVQAVECPFKDIFELVGSLGQYPRNWVDEVADANPRVPLVTKKWIVPKFSGPSTCTAAQYEALAKEVVGAVSGDDAQQAGPTVQRASFHACGTWSQSAQNGGCSGAWHRFAEDMDFPENAGLHETFDWLKGLKETKYKCITYADMFTFAGIVAQEAVGGPATAWYPGRLDADKPGPLAVPFAARLPDGMFNAMGVQYNFLNYGLTVREAVSLIGGGHTFGGADPTTTGWDGSFTPYGDAWPPKGQDNVYFKSLLNWEWELYKVNETNRIQFVPVKGQKGVPTMADNGKRVFRLPSDMALRDSETYAYWVRQYAKNNTLFLEDYQRTYQRTLQFGAGITWEPLTSYKWKGINGNFQGWGPLLEPLLDPMPNPSPDARTAIVDAPPESFAAKPVALNTSPVPKAAAGGRKMV